MKRIVMTLCGSTKYKKEFEDVNAKFTMKGMVVLSVGVFGHADGIRFKKSEKETLDLIHLAKIDMSDSIYVINVGGYIGKSTRREIEYALIKNKQVYFMENSNEFKHYSLSPAQFSQLSYHALVKFLNPPIKRYK